MEARVLADSPRVWRIAWFAPFVSSLVWCALLRPEFRSLAAPLLGPWAGRLYGHDDCTMAAKLPGWSLATVLGGVVLLVVYARLRPSLAHPTLVVWTFAWSALATMSVINTRS
ncbi:MAG: hypothetical protein K8S98_06465 [Planctomycetes bacterium]|nr:hypothetical protein [Planctomycetota bacterium]